MTRSQMIRKAASLPSGNPTRRKLLATLGKTSRAVTLPDLYKQTQEQWFKDVGKATRKMAPSGWMVVPKVSGSHFEVLAHDPEGRNGGQYSVKVFFRGATFLEVRIQTKGYSKELGSFDMTGDMQISSYDAESFAKYKVIPALTTGQLR